MQAWNTACESPVKINLFLPNNLSVRSFFNQTPILLIAASSRRIWFAVILISFANIVQGEDVYQTAEAFLQETFAGQLPKPKMLWLSGDLKKVASEIMGHPYLKLRVKYWQHKQRTAWVLEEIGKEKPITTGFVIDNDHIEKIKVLVFRESRGWEVKHPFFTRQFNDAQLNGDGELDRDIDGITGATLSVQALIRLSHLALYLHQYVQAKEI
jgi:hypothetical protein